MALLDVFQSTICLNLYLIFTHLKRSASTYMLVDDAFTNYKTNISKLTLHSSSQNIPSSKLVWIECKWQRGGAKRKRCVQQLAAREGMAPTLTSHQPPWAGTMQYSSSASQPVSQAAKPAGITPKVLLILLPSNRLPQPQRLVSALPSSQICVCQTVQWRLKSDLRGPSLKPSHSLKSKCTIKNAHLSGSSRLTNAYASYLRDQEKLYCKQYGVSFITYTIQIFSGGGWRDFFSPFFSLAAKKTEP